MGARRRIHPELRGELDLLDPGVLIEPELEFHPVLDDLGGNARVVVPGQPGLALTSFEPPGGSRVHRVAIDRSGCVGQGRGPTLLVRGFGGTAITRNRDWRNLAADLSRAATHLGRTRLGRFSIEGLRLHERALRAGARIEAALIAERLRDDPTPRIRRLLQSLEASGCLLRFAPDEFLERMTRGRGIGPLLGLVPLPPPVTREELLRLCADDRATLLVAVDVEDPGNVGALIRTALAGGARAMIHVGKGDPYHPRAVRTSMGSLFRLPLVRYETIEPLLDDLQAAGFRRLGARSRGGTPVDRIGKGGGRFALFVGSEAFGMPEELLARLDENVSIPMESEIDSYSVNAAAAILLFALRTAQGSA